MRFGPVRLSEAEGAILAHSTRAGTLSVKKGTVLEAAHLKAFEAAGIGEVIAAVLEAGDVAEDEAAARLAEKSAGTGVTCAKAFTGRVNLFSALPGLVRVSREAIDAFNRIDEGITIATVPELSAVPEDAMVATVKIIPFAVPGSATEAALDAISAAGLIEIAPYRLSRVGVVSTLLPGVPEKVLNKTARVLAGRLEPTGATVLREDRVAHDARAVAESVQALKADGAELVIVFGASAIVDRDDVIPEGIGLAGGTVYHFGMPVDPGNLLLTGSLGQTPVIGAAGCARSPRENGFDWVLQRLLAGIEVSAGDVTGMGVGGLLKEIHSRPQPRRGAVEPHPPRIAAIVLAAGQSRRMGAANKLTEEVGGKPMVRIAAEAAVNSKADPVIVVTGHEPDAVTGALSGLDLEIVHNPDFSEGLSTSLLAGTKAVSEDVDGAVVCLGDMPGITAHLIDSLIEAYDSPAGRLIVVPTREGKRGNPVLWDRRFFSGIADLKGDVGARHLIGENADAVFEVVVEDDAVLTDVDTPEALAAMRGDRA